MAEGTIDRLAIEVTGDAEQAVRTLGRLVNRLSNLETRLSMSASKALTFSASISHLSRSLAGLDVSPLKELGGIKFSVTVSKNLASLVGTIQSMPSDAVGKLQGVTTALSSLHGISLTKGTVDSLARMPQVLREFEGMDMVAFGEQVAQLNPKVAELAANVTKLATAYRALPKSMQTAGLAARSVAAANKYLDGVNRELATSSGKATVSVRELGSAIRRAFSFAAVAGAWYSFRRMFEGTVGRVNTYIEDMNLFSVSMGSYAEGVAEYAQKVQDALGIDMGEWSRYTGVFQTLSTSFGIAADRSATMSQNLTQLGYDLASFHNMSVDETMLKIQSGLAGEIEPMRRIGVDLSNAAMQAEAASLGITKLVSDMDQAEKAALRYRLMLRGTAVAQGDMARTITSPANQLRVLQAQFNMAARAIGNLFIPMLNAILPVVIGVVKAIRNLAQCLADFLGIDVNLQVDWSQFDSRVSYGDYGTDGIEDVADSLDDAAGAAKDAKSRLEEYKNTVMGFDELHKLNAIADAAAATTGVGSGKGAKDLDVKGGSVLDQIPLDSYDFLANLTDDIAARTDELAKKIQGMLPWISAVAGGLAAWKIADALLPATLTGIERFKALAGAALTVGGAILYAHGLWDAWVNGMNFNNLMEMLVGATALVTGLGLSFGGVVPIVGGLVTLFGIGVVSLKDMIVSGQNWANVLGAAISGITNGALSLFLKALSSLGEGGGVLADVLSWIERLGGPFPGLVSKVMEFAGRWAPVLSILSKVAAVLGGIVSVVDLVISIKSVFDAVTSGGKIANETIVALVTSILGIGLAVSSVTGPIGIIVAAVAAAVAAIAALVYNNWDEICAFFAGVPEWFDQNVVRPVAGFFRPLVDWFSELWDKIIGGISKAWDGVAKWFDDKVVQPIKEFWSPIVDWFSQLFGSIHATASDVWHNIGVLISGTWKLVQKAWGGAWSWFDSSFLKPLGNAFDLLWKSVSTLAGDAWERVSGKWQSGVAWFDTSVAQPVGKAFEVAWKVVSDRGASAWETLRGTWQGAWGWFESGFLTPLRNGCMGAWDKITEGARETWATIQSVFSMFGNYFADKLSEAWKRVRSVFEGAGGIARGVTDAIGAQFKRMVNSLIDTLNGVIAIPFEKINSIIVKLRSLNIGGLKPFAGLTTISVPKIPHLATGRYGIDAGQLFVAREAGPEMVGTMGGKTTVANNQQIVEGIEAGVFSGVLRALALGGSSGGDTHIEIPLVIDSREVARASWRGETKLVRSGEITATFA